MSQGWLELLQRNSQTPPSWSACCVRSAGCRRSSSATSGAMRPLLGACSRSAIKAFLITTTTSCSGRCHQQKLWQQLWVDQRGGRLSLTVFYTDDCGWFAVLAPRWSRLAFRLDMPVPLTLLPVVFGIDPRHMGVDFGWCLCLAHPLMRILLPLRLLLLHSYVLGQSKTSFQ